MVTLPSLAKMRLMLRRFQNKCLAFGVHYTSFPPEYATPNLAILFAVLLVEALEPFASLGAGCSNPSPLSGQAVGTFECFDDWKNGR
jgi:hypothetical protein